MTLPLDHPVILDDTSLVLCQRRLGEERTVPCQEVFERFGWDQWSEGPPNTKTTLWVRPGCPILSWPELVEWGRLNGLWYEGEEKPSIPQRPFPDPSQDRARSIALVRDRLQVVGRKSGEVELECRGMHGSVIIQRTLARSSPSAYSGASSVWQIRGCPNFPQRVYPSLREAQEAVVYLLAGFSVQSQDEAQKVP